MRYYNSRFPDGRNRPTNHLGSTVVFADVSGSIEVSTLAS